MVPGRRHHTLRMLIDHLMCMNPRSSTLSTNRAGNFPQVSRSACSLWSKKSKSTVPWLRTQQVALPREFHTSPWFAASCCSDGTLAFIQPIRVQKTSEESSSYGSVHPHLAGDVHASVRASGVENARGDARKLKASGFTSWQRS